MREGQLYKIMKEFDFFIIKNLTAKEVNRVDITSLPNADRKGSKEQHTAWAIDPDTKDAFISTIAGRNPAERVSINDNPASFMYGIVADYDIPITEERREKMLNKLAYRPTYVSETFGNGTRAVWMFERPVPLLEDEKYNQAILTEAKRTLGLAQAFGTLDENCYRRLSQYYHRGWNFRNVGGEAINEGMLLLWQQTALKSANWEQHSVNLSLEEIETEIHKRWPNALHSPLREGVRCHRFWEDGADNPTACVCTPHGFICYTGNMPFMSWEQLLGKQFCSKQVFEGEARALKETYYTRNQFWIKLPMTSTNGESRLSWASLNRQNAETLLAKRYGLQSRPKKRGEDSQIKNVIGAVINQKSVVGVIPALYHPTDIVTINDKPYLNISTVQALPPGDTGGQSWGDQFPWIAAFLDRLFGAEQLPYFLSWLARAYQGALNHSPQRGQAVFIAGAAGCGKSFLSAQIMAPLLGGRAEGTDFLTGSSRFNKDVLSSGLIYVDDATMLSDSKAHAHYTAMIKRMCANSDFLYEGKHENAVKIPWLGRLAITLNVDSQSLGVIPATDMSNKDKLMFFRVDDAKLDDPDPESHAHKELPAFAAYLSTYLTPPQCIGEVRYGVKSWLHPELYAESKAMGTTGIFSDLFITFLDRYFGGNNDLTELRGTSLQILQLMNLTDGIREMMGGIASTRSIGSRLGQLLNNENFPLHVRRTATGREWWVTRAEYESYLAAKPQEEE